MTALRSFLGSISLGTMTALVVPIIVVVWTIMIGGPVTEMPFGIQPALQMFSNTIHSLIAAMPWLEVIYDFFIWGIQIKILFLVVELQKKGQTERPR